MYLAGGRLRSPPEIGRNPMPIEIDEPENAMVDKDHVQPSRKALKSTRYRTVPSRNIRLAPRMAKFRGREFFKHV